MHSTALLSGAALVFAGSSLAEVTKTATVTQTTTITGTPSSSKASASFSIYDLYGVNGTVTPDVSIVTAGPTATVYVASCPYQTVSSSSQLCAGLIRPATVTQGPSSLLASPLFYDGNTTNAIGASCTFDGTKSQVCVLSKAGSTNTSAKATFTLTGTDMLSYNPARITGGAYKIHNATAPYATGSGVAKPSGSTGMQTSTGGKPGPTSSSSPSPSPPPHSGAVANAPFMAGIVSVAGLVLAAFAL